MRKEGYNGRWDTSFDPLVDSIAAESIAGQQILDGLQTVLDAVGFIPGLREVADGLNAVVSLLRGDYIDAGLSGFSAIPFADLFTKTGKYIGKGANAAEAVLEYGDEVFEAGEELIEYSDEFAEAGETLSKELQDQLEDDWYHPTEPDILGGEAKIGGAGAGNGRVLWSGGKNAFEAATDFATKNGFKTLEQTMTGKILTTCQNIAKRIFGDEKAYQLLSPLWDKASAKFVRGADGVIHAFLNSQGISDTSVFMRIEYEIAKEQGFEMIFHLVK